MTHKAILAIRPVSCQLLFYPYHDGRWCNKAAAPLRWSSSQSETLLWPSIIALWNLDEETSAAFSKIRAILNEVRCDNHGKEHTIESNALRYIVLSNEPRIREKIKAHRRDASSEETQWSTSDGHTRFISTSWNRNRPRIRRIRLEYVRSTHQLRNDVHSEHKIFRTFCHNSSKN